MVLGRPPVPCTVDWSAASSRCASCCDAHSCHLPVLPPPCCQVEAAVEEALAAGGWCDVMPHVPSILSLSDTAALLAKCKAVLAGGGGAAGAPRVLAGTCVVAAAMLDSIREQLLEAARKAADDAHKAKKARGGVGAAAGAAAAAGKAAEAAGGKKAAPQAAAAAADSDADDDWDMVGGWVGWFGLVWW